MGVSVLTDKELEKIGMYVKRHIGAWLEEERIFPSVAGVNLSERMVRLEEAIKNQGDLLGKLLHQMDKRFEQMDKRFEDMQHYMDKRFSQLQWTTGLGFTILAALMGIFNFF